MVPLVRHAGHACCVDGFAMNSSAQRAPQFDELKDRESVVFINGAEVIGDELIRRAIEQAVRNVLEGDSDGNA